MKVYNPDHNEPLKPALRALLDEFRTRRGFDPAVYAQAKATLLNQYFAGIPLKTAIVALSGGIDSSVVAGLVAFAKKQAGSPIERIIAPTIPARVEGATGQDYAAARAFDVMDALGLERLSIDIAAPHAALTQAVEAALATQGDAWARGQSVAHVRTMSLAYCATLAQMAGQPGIIVGTTNRDEGAYLGYVGKYSDGMVDVQAISDLHKSEVYALARYLELPASTINAIPTGDMYDNRPDTAVFGAPYDFVELYLNYLDLPENERVLALSAFDADARAQFDAMAANIDKLHGYNAHKYTGNQPGSPAFHINILPSAVRGGWVSGDFEPSFVKPANPEKIFNGYFELSDAFLTAAAARGRGVPEIEDRLVTLENDFLPKSARVIKPLIPVEEAEALIAETTGKTWEPAALDGYKLKSPTDAIGSWRATTYSPAYARILWNRLAGVIPMVRTIDPSMDVDAHAFAPDARVWRAVGINPAMRFIKYDPKADNLLFPHYDAPPKGRNVPQTLDTLVIYLTDSVAGTGGETAFIVDPQGPMHPMARNISDDWMRVAKPEEIITAFAPRQGHGLVFPHRTLHSSQRLLPEGAEKIIIRTDIIYKPVMVP